MISFLSGMAVAPKIKHRTETVAILAVFSAFIDIDHVLFSFPRAFHSVFLLLLIPTAGFLVASRYREEVKFRIQTGSILLFVMIFGHMAVDLFNEGVIKPLYPISNISVSSPEIYISTLKENWYVFTPESFLIGMNAVIVLSAYYAENFIYFLEEKNENIRQAAKDSLRL